MCSELGPCQHPFYPDAYFLEFHNKSEIIYVEQDAKLT